MEIIISLLILSAIITVIALYKRSKSLKFRIVDYLSHSGVHTYTPQVRIGGIWYYLETVDITLAPFLSTYKFNDYLDAQDALVLIERFKKSGDLRIHSNRKLISMEKQIIVE